MKEGEKKNNKKLTHSYYIIFEDETRCSTSMRDDGYIDHTKFWTEYGTILQQNTETKSMGSKCYISNEKAV